MSQTSFFLPNVDKNKFCCLVWSHAKAFVSVTSFCLDNSSLFSVIVKADEHPKKRRQGSGGQNKKQTGKGENAW